jgi:hypothetical protein
MVEWYEVQGGSSSESSFLAIGLSEAIRFG